MSWVSWIVGGVAAAGGMAAKEIIANAGKKHLEEPYEAKKKAKDKEELIDDFELEELIRLEEEADKEEPAPKKSRKKKD